MSRLQKKLEFLAEEAKKRRIAAVSLSTEEIRPNPFASPPKPETKTALSEQAIVEKNKTFISEIVKTEIETSEKNNFREPKFSPCPKCFTLAVWLPRVPGIDRSEATNWRCSQCQPPTNPAMVKERKEAASVEREAAITTFGPLDVRESFAAVLVASEVAACLDCRGSWFWETPELGKPIRRHCYSCRAPISEDPPYFDHVSKRPFNLVFDFAE